MNGMLRDLLSERADTAGSPDLDLHDLITRGERASGAVVAWPWPAPQRQWR